MKDRLVEGSIASFMLQSINPYPPVRASQNQMSKTFPVQGNWVYCLGIARKMTQRLQEQANKCMPQRDEWSDLNPRLLIYPNNL